MLKGKRINTYRKTFKGGQAGFMHVYEVVGSDAEVEQYKAAQAEQDRDPVDPETGKVLFWSPNGSGDEVIEITVSERSGKVFENDTNRNALSQAFQKAASLGQAAEQALANEYAKHTVAEIFGNKRKLTLGLTTNTGGAGDGAEAARLAEEARVKAEAAAAGSQE